MSNPGLKITDEMLRTAADIADIDVALCSVMDQVGITTGDVAALALSHIRDEWPGASADERMSWLEHWRDREVTHGRVDTEPLTQAEYVDEPGRCPVCRGENLEGGFVNIDNGTASQPVTCRDCDAEWIDTYTLTGYTELETP